jgi:hypothetical protein
MLDTSAAAYTAMIAAATHRHGWRAGIALICSGARSGADDWVLLPGTTAATYLSSSRR